MWAWLSRARMSRSRTKRATSCEPARWPSGSFSATSRAGWASARVARHTVAMPPLPNSSPSTQGPTCAPRVKPSGSNPAAPGTCGPRANQSCSVRVWWASSMSRSQAATAGSSRSSRASQAGNSAAGRSRAVSNRADTRSQACGVMGAGVSPDMHSLSRGSGGVSGHGQRKPWPRIYRLGGRLPSFRGWSNVRINPPQGV